MSTSGVFQRFLKFVLANKMVITYTFYHMQSSDIREKFFAFFTEYGHAIIPSASLIPENDPTVLFTTAGMHPLVPYLMGEKHPQGNRLANVQKCIRTGDIEEVGDTTHHTFFEMLGNWSLGDYFKEEAIAMSWEFLTSPKWLGLDKEKLAVSVFVGDADAPFDEKAFDLWKQAGIPETRIAKLSKSDNWWGPAGATGPCGPDTEMFYWVGAEKAPTVFDPENDLWVEIWNDVFMQYNKEPNGAYSALAQENVDTGMGLERVSAIVNGLDDNYKTELFQPLIEKIEELSGKKYGESASVKRSLRIIADHVKAAVFIIGDDRGVVPSNVDQGYVVRKLLRRAIRYGKQLDITKEYWMSVLGDSVVTMYKDTYPELEKNREFIIKNLDEEEEKFSKTLEKGLRVLDTKQEATISKISGTYKVNTGERYPTEQYSPHHWDGKNMFYFYQSHGFPFELLVEELVTRGEITKYDVPHLKEGFNKELKKHQELSRKGAEQKFSGGLADHKEETTRLHTATHLLHQALRNVLGDHVEQKGSNITVERLRFDFTHPQKMTLEEKQQVEDMVNEQIQQDIPVDFQEMTVEEAKKQGAIGLFAHKYGEKVKVYTVGGFSKEICGGPHVTRTGELQYFKIKKEEASSAGVRRIKAVLLSKAE